MDLSFIQDQLNIFADFGDAIDDIFSALVNLFGAEGETDGGTFDALSSYEGDDFEASSEDEGSFEASSEDEGSSEDNDEDYSFEGSSDEEF